MITTHDTFENQQKKNDKRLVHSKINKKHDKTHDTFENQQKK